MSMTLAMTEHESRLRLMAEVRSPMRRPADDVIEPSLTDATPPVRQALIQTIREQIEQGVYDTDDKFNAAIDAMFDSLIDPQ